MDATRLFPTTPCGKKRSLQTAKIVGTRIGGTCLLSLPDSLKMLPCAVNFALGLGRAVLKAGFSDYKRHFVSVLVLFLNIDEEKFKRKSCKYHRFMLSFRIY